MKFKGVPSDTKALTPTYLGCVPQQHNWVLTPTYFIGFNDNTMLLHTNKCYA